MQWHCQNAQLIPLPDCCPFCQLLFSGSKQQCAFSEKTNLKKLLKIDILIEAKRALRNVVVKSRASPRESQSTFCGSSCFEVHGLTSGVELLDFTKPLDRRKLFPRPKIHRGNRYRAFCTSFNIVFYASSF